MTQLTGKERISRILARKSVDRIGLYEHIWAETVQKWINEGHIKKEESLSAHFGFDIEESHPFNFMADVHSEPKIIEESEKYILFKDGNGVIKKNFKSTTSVPQLVDFLVKERNVWEEQTKPLLVPDRSRINFEKYRAAKDFARKSNLFFVCSSMNVFELMRALCGHEHMLIGMALDPEWIEDMVNVYSRLIADLQEILFAEEGEPDAVWFSEDLGYKECSFISPAMYRELVQPGHLITMGYAHSRSLPVIFHSCGMIEKLIPDLIQSGINCLQAIEVKAGMNPVRLYKNFGSDISFMGGIDVRVLFNGNKKEIDEELESKIPIIKGNNGYILHSDHSIPINVEYSMYKYLIEKGLDLGTY